MRAKLIKYLLVINFTFSAVVFSQSQNPIELYRLGSEKIIENDLYGATDYFLSALKINPNYFDAIMGVANTYFFLGEYDEAYKRIIDAEKITTNNFNVLNLKAKILLVLGKKEEGKKTLDIILKQDPYNIDAIIGLSQYHLLNGDINSALVAYLGNSTTLGAYSIAPRNKTVLISLALFYEFQKDLNKALSYTKEALIYYPYDAQTQLLAGRIYYKKKEYELARQYVENAIGFSNDLEEGYIIISQILISQNKFEEALDYIKNIIENDPKKLQYYYIYAYLLSKLGRHEEAIEILNKGLILDSDNEFIRAFVDEEIKNIYPNILDENRKKYSDYYYKIAQGYISENSYDKAQALLEEALNIYNGNKEIRKSLSKIQLSRGFIATYIQQLDILIKNGGLTPQEEKQIKESRENYQDIVKNSVANKWGIKEFEVQKRKLTFRIFYKEEDQFLNYFRAEEFLVNKLQRTLEKYPKISFKALGIFDVYDYEPMRVSSYSEAFRIAKESNTDYYMVVSFKESGQFVQENIQIYVSNLGKLIYENNFYSGGKYKLLKSYYKIGDELNSVFQLSGDIVTLNGNEGIINLGKADNIKVGDIFYAIKPQNITLSNSTLNFSYEEKNLTGKIQITALDDQIAEFKIIDMSILNSVGESNQVIIVNNYKENNTINSNNFQILYDKIKNIR